MFKNLFNFLKKSPASETRKFQNAMTGTVENFKAKGISAKELKKKGYPTWVVKSAGYSLKELKEAGYTARALKMAGFSKEKVDALFKK
jgi:hypothetical protein